VHPEWQPDEQDRVARENRRLGIAIRRRGHRVRMLEIQGDHVADTLAPFDPAEAVVFNVCEFVPGLDHSEARVVDVLEGLGFAYTGATAEAIRLSYDKSRVRALLHARGVPVPQWAQFNAPGEVPWKIFPAIVKPAWEHCSLGVDRWSVVLNGDELVQRVAHVIDTYGQPALVEDFIDGREFHVPLWGNETVEMLPPVEMDFSALGDVRDRLCSYESKFSPDSTAYRQIRSRVPARLTPAEWEALEVTCRLAYHLVGCRDYGRIDVRQRGSRMYVLDVNPNADLSADASVALAAKRAGFCYGAMGSRLVELAQNRAPHQ
jgi:D-alanine-D-alanine ligase